MSFLSSLPDEVLKLVMQFVPLKERLTSCCLVNKKLHAAALAVTELEPSWINFRASDERTECFWDWLPLYGQHMTGLELSLEHLTHLCVKYLSVDNLYQLAALTGLQQLFLAVETPVGPLSCPGLVFPSSLTSLWLRSPVEGGIGSLLPARLQALQILECGVEGPAEGLGSLLSSMASVQHLTRLDLQLTGYAWPPACAAYSAITASSTLVELVLCEPALPAGIWPHVFPSTRQLPHLTLLTVGLAFVRQGPHSAWGAGDLCSLVSCCPNLQECAGMLLQPGLHVSEVHKLTTLTRLDLRYGTGSTAGLEDSLKGLAAITQLKCLDAWLLGRDLTVASFLPLTSLTSLSLLRLSYTGQGGLPGAPGYPLKKLASTQDGGPPDVWLQLLECCCADPDGHREATRSLAQQLAHQATSLTLAADRQQCIAELEQRVSAQQQQLATQQGQIADLQGQLAAQAQVMQLLQGQVQQLLHPSAKQ